MRVDGLLIMPPTHAACGGTSHIDGALGDRRAQSVGIARAADARWARGGETDQWPDLTYHLPYDTVSVLGISIGAEMGQIEKLERLSALFEKGLITEDEFKDQKKAILSPGLGPTGPAATEPTAQQPSQGPPPEAESTSQA